MVVFGRIEVVLCAKDFLVEDDFSKAFDGLLEGYVHQIPKVAARMPTNRWPGPS